MYYYYTAHMGKLSGTITTDNCEFNDDEIHNTKVLINEINARILSCIQSGRDSYTLNTGQTNQAVKNISLKDLIDQKNTLIDYLANLELVCGVTSSSIQVVPEC